MGDSYRPGGGSDGRGRYQDSGYNRPDDRSYRSSRYDSYPPPPPPPHSYYDRPPGGTSSYRPPPPPPSFNGPPPGQRGDAFAFRGAAGGQSYRPEQNFTFDAPGPRAPNGFAPDGPRASHERPRRFDRDGGRSRHEGRGRGSGAPRSRGRGGFGPKPAHDRAILNKLADARDTTPEKLEGMDEGQTSRFKDVVESSEDEGSDGDAPRKRTKVEPSEAPAAPKWSNPDPYTALPPPETLGAPKKDIVQVIRKAKNEQAPKTDKVADNSDFISFNFDDDEKTETDRPLSPPAKSPARTGEASFSHRDSFHRKTSAAAASAANGASSNPFTPINERSYQRPTAPISISSGASDYDDPQPSRPQYRIPEPVSRPPKRKHRDNRQHGDVTEEWQAVDAQPVAPWCKTDHSDTADVGLRLHKEICDFFEYIQPRDFEREARLDLVVRIQAAIRAYGGANGHAINAEVHCFGSFASGFYLPTADMDLVVLSRSFVNGGPRQLGQSMNQLRGLTQHIEKLGIAKPQTATFIGRAKVPLVKFTDKRTGIKVDISFENDSGFPAIQTFESWKAQYPALPVLISLVKQFLVMRNLNEVFSGGIGGFTTICLATHILQILPEIQSGSMDPSQHYGDLFMKFLDFYGNKLDIRSSGIIMHPPYHYDKVKHPSSTQNRERLTIIDPNNPDNDISGGSHKIDTVFGRFRMAYSELQRYTSQLHQGHVSTRSILECILGGNYKPIETQRERLRELYGRDIATTAPALAPAPTIPPGVKDIPPPRNPNKPNKKAKKRAEEARQAAAKGQYAPAAAPSAPQYVVPMANPPFGYGAALGGGTPPSPPSFFLHSSPYHKFAIPPPPSEPPHPPPLRRTPPTPPPCQPKGIEPPPSPCSSKSMDMSD